MSLLEDLLENTVEGLGLIVEGVADIAADSMKNLQEGFLEIREEAAHDIQEFGVELHETLVKEASAVDEDLGKGINAVLTIPRNVVETISNPLRHGTTVFEIAEKSISVKECRLADHLYRWGDGGVYTHHGIYSGNGCVIHYAVDKKGTVCIHEDSFAQFAGGYPVYRMPLGEGPLIYTPEEAVRRARSRLGERRYHVLINNCENFVRWCRYGSRDNTFE